MSFTSERVFSHKVFNEVMLTHGNGHIIFFAHRGFSRIIYDILILDKIVFRLCLWDYLKGLKRSELYISWHFFLFFPLSFKKFYLLYQYTLVFPTGFSKVLKTMTDKQITVPIQDQLIKRGVRIN